MLSHMDHIGWIVGLAAVRDRCKIGAVSLDQHAIHRHKTGHFAQVGCVLEGQDAGKGDVKAQIQRRPGHLCGLRKTVENATGRAGRAIFALFLQDGQGVVGSAAGVDDQGLVELLAGPDMSAKALALPFHVGHGAYAQPVIVEAGFSDADHPRQAAAPDKIVQAGFGHVFIVRVHTHRGPEVVIGQGQAMYLVEFFQRGADAQGPADLRLGHGLTYARQILAQLGKTQMTVGVGVHDRGTGARPHAKRARPQMVCVVRSEDRWEPRISSILFLSMRDFSSAGKRTPTPWVRVPAALAGVTQATLPAIG